MLPGQEALELFAKYGGLFGLILGVLILGMGTAAVFLWRQNGTLQERLLEVQNKRVDEAKEVRAELAGQADDTAKVLNEMSSAIQGMTLAIQSLKDTIILRDNGRR